MYNFILPIYPRSDAPHPSQSLRRAAACLLICLSLIGAGCFSDNQHENQPSQGTSQTQFKTNVVADLMESFPGPTFDPRHYGAKGDGVTCDTEAIQKAIEACGGTGGRVVMGPGHYVTRPIRLLGRMTFHLQKGAILLGSTNLADYPVMLPSHLSHNALGRCLLYAYEADDLTLEGEGEIDGRCKEMNMPAELKKGGTEGERPSLIHIFHSKNTTVRGVTLRNPCMWTQIYTECTKLVLDHVTVDAPTNCPNLDGMDICDCHDVIIRNCDVRSEDDSICLKSMSQVGLQNILVENNRIRCFRANAIKLGTSTRGPVSHILIRSNIVEYAKYGGLCIESVDGSEVRDVVVQDLDLYKVGQPIFIRLADRRGAAGNLKKGKQKPGAMDGVTIERLRAFGTHQDTIGTCTITGIPGAQVQNVRLKDCYIEMPGGLEKIPKLPAEREDRYPQSNMFGNTPGYAFFVRHATGVVFENVRIGSHQPDVRPWLTTDDAQVEVIRSSDLGQIKPGAGDETAALK